MRCERGLPASATPSHGTRVVGKTGVRDAPMDNIVAVHHEVRQNLSRNLLEQ